MISKAGLAVQTWPVLSMQYCTVMYLIEDAVLENEIAQCVFTIQLSQIRYTLCDIQLDAEDWA